MVMEFPDDPACAYVDRQFMLGSALLAAPVFNESGIVNYYLPHGKWTNIITGEVIEGGSWKTEKHGYFSLPLLARPNSILPLGSNISRPDYEYADGIVFHLFELDNDKTAAFEVCDCRGNIEGELVVSRKENKLTIITKNLKKTRSLCLRNIHRVNSSSGAEAKDSKEGLLLTLNGDTEKAIAELYA